MIDEMFVRRRKVFLERLESLYDLLELEIGSRDPYLSVRRCNAGDPFYMGSAAVHGFMALEAPL